MQFIPSHFWDQTELHYQHVSLLAQLLVTWVSGKYSKQAIYWSAVDDIFTCVGGRRIWRTKAADPACIHRPGRTCCEISRLSVRLAFISGGYESLTHLADSRRHLVIPHTPCLCTLSTLTWVNLTGLWPSRPCFRNTILVEHEIQTSGSVGELCYSATSCFQSVYKGDLTLWSV